MTKLYNFYWFLRYGLVEAIVDEWSVLRAANAQKISIPEYIDKVCNSCGPDWISLKNPMVGTQDE